MNSGIFRISTELCSGRGPDEDKNPTKVLITAKLIWSFRSKSLTLQHLELKSQISSSARHIERRLSTLDSDVLKLRNFQISVRMKQR